MSKFNVGDIVVVTASNKELAKSLVNTQITQGSILEVVEVDGSLFKLKGDSAARWTHETHSELASDYLERGMKVEVITPYDDLIVGFLDTSVDKGSVYPINGVYMDSFVSLKLDKSLANNIHLLDVKVHESEFEPKVKPKVKPKVTPSSSRRQFDVTFKIQIARTASDIRRTKKGSLRQLAREYSIDHSLVRYWERQFAEGHFSSCRAVAFSRKTTMIKG